MLILVQTIKNFRDDESGIATAWAMSWLILCFAIAGLSIDVTNAWKVKQFLQSTADVAAHAGAVELGEHDNASILAAVQVEANAYAFENMNPGQFGDVLIENDIHVGFWDNDAGTFTELVSGDTEEPNAVYVITRQDGTDGASNSVGTFFLKFVWKNAFTVSSSAIVERFMSICERDGMFAFNDTNFSAQQHLTDDYCIYGANGITFAQQNTFDAGTVAMTNNLNNCGPSSTSCTNAHNNGIEEALKQGRISNSKVANIQTYITELQNPYSEYQPDYIDTNALVIKIPSADFDASTLEAGRIYVVRCSNGQNLDLGVPSAGGNGNGNAGGGGSAAAITKSEFVLVGLGCDFVFDTSVQYEDAMFLTTATGNQTISGSAGVVLGRDDSCTQGGEVVAITAGSVHFSAKLEAYDVEFIIADDLHLASNGNADSVHTGSNFYVGGDVRVTSQHTFAGCNGTTVPPFDPKYSFRIVR